MTYQSISAADFLSDEEIEEARFLAALKGLIREELASQAPPDKVATQAQLAERCGMDPAQLSRALSPDHHISTKTLFRIAYALDRRLVVGLARRAGMQATNYRSPTWTTKVEGALAPTPQPPNPVEATTSEVAPRLTTAGAPSRLSASLVDA